MRRSPSFPSCKLSLGFGWTVPLFDRNQAARAEAGAREDAARARLALAEARARAMHGMLEPKA